jgi:large subunit ribosomal protein L2
MNLKFYKPVTPSLRHSITSNFKILNKNPLLKSKIVGFKNSSGRNNQGKITVYGKGCGHKKNIENWSLLIILQKVLLLV